MGLETAKKVLKTEAEAIERAMLRIGKEFEEAENIILETRGRVIVTGLGKSGLIGKKIAATFSSIGIPSFYLHPVEGAHGDIGMVMRGDTALVISKSGATDELNSILYHLKRLEIPIIAITGNLTSSLASVADVVLDASVECEACPYNIVPTASTTVTLALGDALAISLFSKKGLTEEDFAALHPGGALGKKLTWRVKDLMIGYEELPIADISMTMDRVMDIMTDKKLGIAIITEKGKLTGVITDGDLRRLFQRVERPLKATAGEALEKTAREGEPRKSPVTVSPEDFTARAVNIMEKHVITSLVVTGSEKEPLGLIRWIDLSLAGIV